MGRITSFSKQVIVFFLVTALIIRPTFAANVGGWSMGNPVAQGASVVYEGTKKIVLNGADYIKKGTAKITPPASGVAKVLAKGVAGYALSIVVQELLGAVDWVLDPANNRIKYYEQGQTCAVTSCPSIYWHPDSGGISKPSYSLAQACAALQPKYDSNGSGIKVSVSTHPYCQLTFPNGNSAGRVQILVSPNPQTQEQEKEEKYLPLDVVANKVISNAESGDTNAQVATTAAAADIVAEAEKDDAKARPIAQQLEASAQTKPADEAAAEKANEATGTSKPNTANPEATDLALEFPVFCRWAPTVCEAAQTVISFPTTLIDWWNTGKTKAEEWSTSISESWTKVKEEYADKPEENTDTELDIPDLSDESIDSDISFGGSCPAPLSSDINFMGLNKTIEFSFDPVCQIAEFIKPVVISISAFSAALIVAGIRTEDD